MQISFGNKAKAAYNWLMGESESKAHAKIRVEAQVFPDGFVPGQVLGGKYKVISLLGQGGMGSVYLVQQVFLNKKLALKTLNKVSVTEIKLQRFQLEAKAAASLRHPNLVQVHDFGLLDDGLPYLVMDFIEGFSLADLLKQRGSLPLEEVTPIFAQACFGLLAAHEKGIVHRDIKPANIMLLKNLSIDTEGSVKVVDFGIAKLTSQETGEVQSLTRTGDVFGSPLYMSPEQCSGGIVDSRSDIYSLGCVLFEMLTGTPPYMGQNALITMKLHETGALASLKEASMGKQFPEALEHIVAKMLSKSPGQRYQNVGLVAHDMASVCKGRALTDVRPVEKVAKPARVISMNEPRFFLIVISTVLFTAVTAGTGGYLYRQSQLTSIQSHKNGRKQVNASVNSTNKEAKQPAEMDSSTIGAFIDDVAGPVDRFKAELTKFGPIRSTLVNGGTEKEFTFPDSEVGTLCEITDAPDYKRLCTAEGTVRVPAKVPLLLKVEGQTALAVLDAPSFFSKIDPREFSGLALTRSGTDKLFKMSTNENTDTNLEAITTIVARWSRLEVLMLNNLPVTEATIANISEVKHLRHLQLYACEVNLANLARQPFLNQLKSLTLGKVKNVKYIIHAVSKSANLNHLQLLDTEVDYDSLRELQHLPALSVRDHAVDDKFIQTVTELSQLKRIGVLGKLGPEQLKTLIACPHLIRIELAEEYYSPDLQQRLKRSSEKVVFVRSTHSDVTGGGDIFEIIGRTH